MQAVSLGFLEPVPDLAWARPMTSEPTTEAGRDLIREHGHKFNSVAHMAKHILAIEQEARTAADALVERLQGTLSLVVKERDAADARADAAEREVERLRAKWFDFVEPMVEALHGFHARIGIEQCDVERCREWMVLRTEGAPTADEVRGILKAPSAVEPRESE